MIELAGLTTEPKTRNQGRLLLYKGPGDLKSRGKAIIVDEKGGCCHTGLLQTGRGMERGLPADEPPTMWKMKGKHRDCDPPFKMERRYIEREWRNCCTWNL